MKNERDQDRHAGAVADRHGRHGRHAPLRHGRAVRRQEHDLHDRRQDRHGAGVHASAQNERLDNQKTVSDRLRDHSWFIAFAPAEHPRIAVAVIVENGGFGARVASPIARKVMDAYLLDANGQLKVPLPPGTAAADARPPGSTPSFRQGRSAPAASGPADQRRSD